MWEENRMENNSNGVQENKMGVMPVGKLLANMSLPMIISMLVQAMYNIVDSLFVSRIDEDALTAVSLAFPVQNLMIGIAVGTGVGINALLSMSLGSKDFESANKAAVNGIFLAVLSSFIFMALSFFVPELYYKSQTDSAHIIGYGVDYLSIVTFCAFAVYCQMTFERLLQSTGKTIFTMITQGLGAIINIILDPIFIFGYFGVPKMGIKGAAYATVCGQFIAFMLALFFNLKFNKEIHISFKGFKPEGRIIKRIYSVGVPSMVMNAIVSVMTYGINGILMGFSSTATAVYGVYVKLQSFALMPVFGLNNGMVPIVAYNYGAKRKDRIMGTYKLSVISAMGIMLVCLAVMQIFPKQLLLMFKASEEMLKIGIPAIRIISLSFIFAGYSIVTSSMLQALGHGVKSMIISVCRQLVVLLPVAYLMSLTGNLDLVWLAVPIAELVSLTLSTVFMVGLYKNVIKKLA
jgi:putative MATE family efflux protein